MHEFFLPPKLVQFKQRHNNNKRYILIRAERTGKESI